MSGPVKLTCTTCGQANRLPAERLASKPKCGVCGEALVSAKVQELDLKAHDKATRSDEIPLLVDYWAPWCGPCRSMAPEFSKAAQALTPHMRLAKINTEDYPGVSQRLGIRGIPLLILWHKGREVARLAGARPSSDIIAFARQATAKG